MIIWCTSALWWPLWWYYSTVCITWVTSLFCSAFIVPRCVVWWAAVTVAVCRRQRRFLTTMGLDCWFPCLGSASGKVSLILSLALPLSFFPEPVGGFLDVPALVGRNPWALPHVFRPNLVGWVTSGVCCSSSVSLGLVPFLRFSEVSCLCCPFSGRKFSWPRSARTAWPCSACWISWLTPLPWCWAALLGGNLLGNLSKQACCAGCRADPTRCNSTSRQNRPIQQNCRLGVTTPLRYFNKRMTYWIS